MSGRRSPVPRAAWLAVLLAAGIPAWLGAADAAAIDADAAARAKTRELLAYGIDTQVLEVVAKLGAARDTDYTEELAALLDPARSPEVRTAVFALFADLGAGEGEPAALAIVADPPAGAPSLTAAAVAYLATRKPPGLAARLLPLVDSPDAVVASTALRVIGETRDPAAVEPLLARLADVEFPDGRKSEVVAALGALGDARAVDALLPIARGRDQEKTRRLFAADALGRIGDPRALPVLKGLFAEDDALVRAYAASALAAFGMTEALPYLLAGLRDANARVRLQCTKALARQLAPGEAAEVVPVVRWKAENDPDRSVRLESVRALGEIADTPSVAYLEALLLNAGASLEFREAALAALLARTPGSAGIRTAVEREIVAKDTKPIEMMTRVLAERKVAGTGDVLTRLLDAPGWTVRLVAARGLAAAGVTSAVERLRELAEKDAVAAVRAEAAKALERLGATK